MIIERLSQEQRNIEKLLAILERELQVFDRGHRPDYKVIGAVISYFELYPEVYHHPQEDLVFAKLKIRDPGAAAKVGDLAREHQTRGRMFAPRRSCDREYSRGSRTPSARCACHRS